MFRTAVFCCYQHRRKFGYENELPATTSDGWPGGFFLAELKPPAYQVLVTDGRLSTNPQAAEITFFWKPVLTHNQFLTNSGQTTVLTTDNIAATRNSTLAKDLQFVVTGAVKHGRFEQHGNSGSAITSFYQQDILQQNIQFIHDNSTSAPTYSLLVRDNQSGLSSDAEVGKTLLVVNNYFPVNQWEILLITESVLNATGDPAQDRGNIVFAPITGTVQHGHFALTTAPDYPLISFQQHQIRRIKSFLCRITPPAHRAAI